MRGKEWKKKAKKVPKGGEARKNLRRVLEAGMETQPQTRGGKKMWWLTYADKVWNQVCPKRRTNTGKKRRSDKAENNSTVYSRKGGRRNGESTK